MRSLQFLVILIVQASIAPGAALRRFENLDLVHLKNGQKELDASQCGKVVEFEDTSFTFCQPPGALSEEFFHHGTEYSISKAFQTIIKEDRVQHPEQKPLVLDVGMNEGWYTLLSAAFGAKVMSFEVQPGCLDMVKQAVSLNKFDDNVKLINAGANDKKGALQVDATKCDATNHISFAKGPRVEVTLVKLDDAVVANGDFQATPISLLKIDAEAAETRILRGAMDLITAGKIRRMIVEVSPQWWQRMKEGAKEGTQTLLQVLREGKYMPYVFPNEGEGLEVGLGLRYSKYGVPGMREVTDMHAFIQDRIKKNRGCNLLFV